MRPPEPKKRLSVWWLYGAMLTGAVSVVLSLFTPKPDESLRGGGADAVLFRVSCDNGVVPEVKCKASAPLKFEYISPVPGYGAVFEVADGAWTPLTNDTGALPAVKGLTPLSAQAMSTGKPTAWVFVFSAVPIDTADVLLRATQQPEDLKKPGLQVRVIKQP